MARNTLFNFRHVIHLSFLLQASETFFQQEVANFSDAISYSNILERHTGCCTSEDKCSKLCLHHSKCVSFFFNNQSDQCQLHSVQITELTDLQLREGWRYFWQVAEDCDEVLQNGNKDDGVYTIYVNRKPHDVYCDMTTAGGGWIVFQKRFNGSVDFLKNWIDYANGFGDLGAEFWLGNEILFELTSVNTYKLRIDMEDYDGIWKYAEYKSFAISSNITGYTMTLADYSGNAGDSLSSHSDKRFATKDNPDIHNCVAHFKGSWWYRNCHSSNLNGLYNVSDYAKGMNWLTWHGYHYSLRQTEMKIKRV